MMPQHSRTQKINVLLSFNFSDVGDKVHVLWLYSWLSVVQYLCTDIHDREQHHGEIIRHKGGCEPVVFQEHGEPAEETEYAYHDECVPRKEKSVISD